MDSSSTASDSAENTRAERNNGSTTTYRQNIPSDIEMNQQQPPVNATGDQQSTANVNAMGNNAPTGANATNSNQTNSNTFLPLTRARMRENLDNQGVIDINNITEPQGTDEAATKARFHPFKLSEDEFAVFHVLIKDDPDKFDAYLHIRNRILEKWFENVQVELAYENVLEIIDEGPVNKIPIEDRKPMLTKTYHFLERTGRINFGIIESKYEPQYLDNSEYDGLFAQRAHHMPLNMYKPPLKSASMGNLKGRVIIIGAGLSGLVAARQLQKFGMEVLIVEARHRVGGRVHTYRRGNFIADLGPSSINGVVGNPVVVLGKQLELCVMELRHKIPVFENRVDKNGASVCHPVDNYLERAIEREYNKIMEGTRVMKNNYRIESYRGKPFSVGMCVDWVMKLQEKNIKDDQIAHLKSIENLYLQLIESANKKLEKTRIIKNLHGQLCSIKDSTDLGNHRDKGAIDTFNRRSLARDLDLAIKEYKILREKENEIHQQIDQLNSYPPSDTYLSLSDRRLLDWHFAELEYALGCPINKLGIYYDDDEEVFDGSHWMPVHGFNTIVEAMKTDLDIALGTAVKKITVTKSGCKVLTYQPEQAYGPYTELTADAVLCTLPLGVLQESIIPSQQAAADNSKETPRTPAKGYQPVIFSPPLPRWKTQSLNKLGCGNLNKIVLSFDKVFWDQRLHLFGAVNHKAVSRGEFFLFWHHGRTPTLTGLISGEAADYIEKLSDVEVLDRCLGVLRSIYGNALVPAPKDYVVTKWRKDPWAKGAWSYLQTGATGEDYDVCAQSVILEADEKSFRENNTDDAAGISNNPFIRKVDAQDERIPRLFFAGEHTTKFHFASAHGAILTGLREAAKIANIYLGCPYDDEYPGVYLGPLADSALSHQKKQ